MLALATWAGVCLDSITKMPGADPISLEMIRLGRKLPPPLRDPVERRVRRLTQYLRTLDPAQGYFVLQERLESFRHSPPHPSLIAVAPLVRLHDWNDEKWMQRTELPPKPHGTWEMEAAEWLARAVEQLETASLIPERASLGNDADALEKLLLDVGDHPRRVDSRDDVRALSPKEAVELMSKIVDEWPRTISGRQVGEALLATLAALRPEALRGFHARLARLGVMHPGYIYRWADAEARDLLIAQAATAPDSDHLLKSLAFLGDEVVAETFVRWTERAPNWQSKLHVKAAEYAPEGGWEVDGKRVRRLVPDLCWQLILDPDGPIASNVESQTRCGSCQNPLTVMLELTCTELELEAVPFLWCYVCYGTTFVALEEKGLRWLAASDKTVEGVEYQAFEPQRFRLQPVPSPLVPLVIDGSFVGGHPSWRNDALFPICPQCDQSMPYVGQVDTDAGMSYLFFCRSCRLTAVAAQCT